MTQKITPELAVNLGLCYNAEQAEAAAAAGGQDEYTVDELLLGTFLDYDDAMFMVCRTEVTPPSVLREFATLVAREAMPIITKGLGSVPVFFAALEFLESGEADDDIATLEGHAEAIQRYMVGQLVIEGTGDWTKPDKIAEYETLLNACKTVRAATKTNPGEAAYGAANWAYRAARGSHRDELGRKHRGQLAKIFKASA